MRVIFLFTLLISSALAQAQTMVLNEDRSKDTVPSTYGPNLSRFTHIFIGLGITVDEGEKGAATKHGFPGEIFFGTRTKYKIGSVYSLGYEFGAHWQYYRLEQEQEKILPDTFIHDAERFDMILPHLTFFQRFNFDPGRGNYIGKYLDIGISGFGALSFAHVAKKENADDSKSKVVTRHLPYTEKLGYSSTARLANNRFVLYATYRISDFFKSKYGYPELPRLMVGLELGLFKY